MVKGKHIAIFFVLLAVGFAVYKFVSSRTGKATGEVAREKQNAGIPVEVQKHLRDFEDGEKMTYQGKQYQVENGSWITL